MIKSIAFGNQAAVRWPSLVLVMFIVSFGVHALAVEISFSEARKFRYGYSADGYNQDRDDVAGSAMTVALFDKSGLADRLVHFHFNTNFGGEPSHADDHRSSALETAVLFGIIEHVDGDDAFFDVSRPKEKEAAIQHLADEFRKSSAENPMKFFCAGGVQVPFAALKRAIEQGAQEDALRAITFVSHSQANENTRRKGDENKDYNPNWDTLKQLTPHSTFVDYTSPKVNGRRDGGVNPSQNSTAWNQAPRSRRGGVEPWQWLVKYGPHVEGFGFSGTKGEWLLKCLKAAGKPEIGHNGDAEGDASDAGMVYSQLPGGISDATMDEIRDYFLGNSAE
jgi:hypothetical protein